jgi:hypothetical protein
MRGLQVSGADRLGLELAHDRKHGLPEVLDLLDGGQVPSRNRSTPCFSYSGER